MVSASYSLLLSMFSVIVSSLAFYLLIKKDKVSQKKQPDFTTKPMQLQAYERLVILAERIALPNLIGRLNQQDLSVKEMQLLLLSNIKQEFEHNFSQQIYVTQTAWQSLQKLKDQNMLIVNQVAQTLPTNATSFDLSRTILELILKQEKNALHLIVLDALNFEARKLMR